MSLAVVLSGSTALWIGISRRIPFMKGPTAGMNCGSWVSPAYLVISGTCLWAVCSAYGDSKGSFSRFF